MLYCLAFCIQPFLQIVTWNFTSIYPNVFRLQQQTERISQNLTAYYPFSLSGYNPNVTLAVYVYTDIYLTVAVDVFDGVLFCAVLLPTRCLGWALGLN